MVVALFLNFIISRATPVDSFLRGVACSSASCLEFLQMSSSRKQPLILSLCSMFHLAFLFPQINVENFFRNRAKHSRTVESGFSYSEIAKRTSVSKALTGKVKARQALICVGGKVQLSFLNGTQTSSFVKSGRGTKERTQTR